LPADAVLGTPLWVESGLEIGRALGAGVLDLAQATAIGLNLNVIAQAAASGADQRLRSQEDTSFSIPFDPIPPEADLRSWGKRIDAEGLRPSARPDGWHGRSIACP